MKTTLSILVCFLSLACGAASSYFDLDGQNSVLFGSFTGNGAGISNAGISLVASNQINKNATNYVNQITNAGAFSVLGNAATSTLATHLSNTDSNAILAQATNSFVMKSGDTMTGTLGLQQIDDSGNFVAFLVDSRIFRDTGGSAKSADMSLRRLYASDGSTVNLNWNTAGAITINGVLTSNNIPGLSATNLVAGTVPTARLGSGSATANTFLSGAQTYSSIPDAGLSANVALLNGNQTFTGSNVFSISAISNGFGIYINGVMVFNVNGTNGVVTATTNLVFGAQKQSWRPSSISGFESTLSARKGDGSIGGLEVSSISTRQSETSGGRSALLLDTGGGGGGLWLDSQMTIGWTDSTTDGSGTKTVTVDHSANGTLRVVATAINLSSSTAVISTNGFTSTLSNASPVITITLPANDANNATMWTNNFGASGVLAFQGATAARMDSGTISIAQTAWKQWPMMVTTAGSIPLRANETVSITNTFQPTLVTFKFAP